MLSLETTITLRTLAREGDKHSLLYLMANITSPPEQKINNISGPALMKANHKARHKCIPCQDIPKIRAVDPNRKEYPLKPQVDKTSY